MTRQWQAAGDRRRRAASDRLTSEKPIPLARLQFRRVAKREERGVPCGFRQEYGSYWKEWRWWFALSTLYQDYKRVCRWFKTKNWSLHLPKWGSARENFCGRCCRGRWRWLWSYGVAWSNLRRRYRILVRIRTSIRNCRAATNWRSRGRRRHRQWRV